MSFNIHDHERSLELEAIYPNLKFARYPEDYTIPELAGKVLDWGAVPEQATGTLDGNPFYYRFRSNTGRLEVWDKNDVGESAGAAPNWNFDPILYCKVYDWVPGDDLLGWTEGTELFRYLIDNLSPPQKEDLYSTRLAKLCELNWLVKSKELSKYLVEEFSTVIPYERTSSWDETCELYLRLSNNSTLALNWNGYSAREGKSNLNFRVYPPGMNALQNDREYCLITSVEVRNNMSPKNLADFIVEVLPELKWQDKEMFEVSLFNKVKPTELTDANAIKLVEELLDEFKREE